VKGRKGPRGANTKEKFWRNKAEQNGTVEMAGLLGANLWKLFEWPKD
jgi:hypothetical protein